jgi:Zn2+/Cd2+-exporting ATPase
VLLTGEGAAIAYATGKQLGVDVVHAALLPDDKVAQRQVMLTARSTVAMVGWRVGPVPLVVVGAAIGAMGLI